MPTELDTLTLEELEERVDPALHAALWGDWAGREEAYYRATRDIVAQLKRNDFERVLIDDEINAAVEKVQSLIADLAQSS